MDQAPARRGQLALALQETFTATVRLRANRQVAADAESFRQHVKQLLSAAEGEGRRAGYSDAEVRLALFAAVAFLDESVLNSTQPMFAEWPRRPLQDEIFGSHTAGELFFTYLRVLLAQPDSEPLADVLEVFELCLRLGFQGRYGGAASADLQVLASQTADKIRRIRGAPEELAPGWRPPQETIAAPGDPWTRRLGVAAASMAALTLVLFVVFHLVLRSGIAEAAGVAR